MMGSSELQEMPQWLETILSEKFFVPCSIHETSKKNEKNLKNILCLDCCLSFCPHCLPPHRPHRLLQIRRYVYHDVVRVDDLGRLIDLDSVQSYTTNNAKVVFINERTQTRSFRGGSGNVCHTCDRSLQDPYHYCSLHCKVKRLLTSEGGLSKHLKECEYLPLPTFCDLDEGQLTPDSILDATSSGSTASGAGGPGATRSTADTEFLARKKRSNAVSPGRQAGQPAGSDIVNRRKQTNPSRAPLF